MTPCPVNNRPRFRVGDALCLVVNLDSNSRHFQTVSLFKNGTRINPPEPLPKEIHGKVLYPMVGVRSVSVAVNFGGGARRPAHELPFKVRMWDDAAEEDIVSSPVVPPADAVYDLVVPVGVPNEGTFGFLDHALYASEEASTKWYVEISERAAVQWCVDSGWRKAPSRQGLMAFGFTMKDFLPTWVRLAAARKRNYVLAHDRSSLSTSERSRLLS